jgi:hypothetical protein
MVERIACLEEAQRNVGGTAVRLTGSTLYDRKMAVQAKRVRSSFEGFKDQTRLWKMEIY